MFPKSVSSGQYVLDSLNSSSSRTTVNKDTLSEIPSSQRLGYLAFTDKDTGSILVRELRSHKRMGWPNKTHSAFKEDDLDIPTASTSKPGRNSNLQPQFLIPGSSMLRSLILPTTTLDTRCTKCCSEHLTMPPVLIASRGTIGTPFQALKPKFEWQSHILHQ